MKLRDFVATHRAELDTYINSRLTYVPRTASCYCPKNGTDHNHEPERLNDSERRLWILNDEGLYNWARSEGVRI